MTKDQREALLDAGMRIAHARGFGAVGVRQIAAAAGVPEGSFTNHFRSKETFGILVLDRYEAKLDRIMAETLDDETLAPAERLKAYFERISKNVAAAKWQIGCIVPDLATEISAHSEELRARLCEVLTRQSTKFEAVLCLALPEKKDASELGAFILAAWHGTLLRMKAERSHAAVDRFCRVLATLI